MEKLRIGHDDSGFKSGWHLEKVVVRTMVTEAESEETEFAANRWLASDEGIVEISRRISDKIYFRENQFFDVTLQVVESGQDYFDWRSTQYLAKTVQLGLYFIK